ncbi:Arylsulfatase B [Hondaea fermentalgiana]|uniref:Arylsulfatase B n=1 Tax=Hondaea fermentalgiana TaxID=2315210 RepID=A0A2R5GA99_9STRA|nr:Arylsulfatase B [Hondaea fermentalgiana]|eukprot:GBG25001.1 Arylsulfatase B [Hondaea fermentalgiana]
MNRDTNATKKPNIIFMLVDDLGYADIGYRNDNEIDTPHLNSIVARGLDLERYYVHCVCSPSRGALMTGRFAHHLGLHNWLWPANNIAVELDEVFLPEKLKEVGYKTHMIGKWHLGHHKWGYTPNYRGFDTYYGYYTGGGDYYMGLCDTQRLWFQYLDAKKPKCSDEPSCVRIPWEAQGRYSTEVFGEKAVEIIDNHNTSEPLFLYLAFQAVHAGFFQPDQVPPRYVEPYENRIPPGKRRQFAGMLSAVDMAVGKVLEALERNGFTDDNTLIIVSTDNGGPVFVGDGVGSRNTPFRGGKHALYEGGVRGVAFIAGYGIQQRGGTYPGLMHISDWFATLADVAGYSLDTKKPLDGVSHWERLSAPPGKTFDGPALRTKVVLGNVSDHGIGFGVLYDDEDGKTWKIITGTPGYPPFLSDEAPDLLHGDKGKPCHNGFCLFEIQSDPIEQYDLALNASYASKLDEMRKRLLEEWATAHHLVPDCDIQPIPKFEEHVHYAWWPYCDKDGSPLGNDAILQER